ncbi:hypothetical protein Taro_004572, partial [Colocasia esculenta]|nr:hypothetical protein [Colocasia esculenta]
MLMIIAWVFSKMLTFSLILQMGFQFASKAVYTAVWVAAVSLFMELLGFSTQKWLTAGGLGTVLLTLAGREIFTNFLSSVMIHATRPFVLNEWIQTKIEGYEVSGTVEHVGWWSPTIIRGDDREAVHIPNHKFTVSVVRNLSQKTHWRIKTHLAISHLDVDKINNIVADMRKVLGKNPQVEQQKLHRRVFLDNVDPENQALLILVSCFVKTSHFEEYLCVKVVNLLLLTCGENDLQEAVLLDLLRIIRHHRARLATPIRTVQKMHGDGDVENIPFSETIFSRSGAAESRPLLLIEHPTRINGEESNKARQAAHANEESKAATSDLRSTSSIPEEPLDANSDKLPPHQKAGSVDAHLDSEGLAEENPGDKQQKDIMAGDGYVKSSKTDLALSPPISSNSSTQRTDGGSDAASLQTKPESERLQVPPSPAVTSRPTLEDNIVLGVALDGAKRMLPIEEGMGPSSSAMDSKELASLCSASAAGSPTSSKEKKDGPNSAPGGSVEQRDQER